MTEHTPAADPSVKITVIPFVPDMSFCYLITGYGRRPSGYKRLILPHCKENPSRRTPDLVVQKKPSFLITASACSLVFLLLLAIRLDLFSRFQFNRRLSGAESLHELADKDSWMRIYQADRPVGYAHRSVTRQKEGNGFTVAETVFMRINTMGLVQDIHLQTEGRSWPRILRCNPLISR